MRRTRFITAIILAMCCLTAAHGQDAGERARQARAELQQLQTKIAQVKEELAQGREHHDELVDQLTRAGQAVRQAASQLDALSQDVAVLTQEVTRLRQKRDQEKAHLGDQLDTLRTQVRAAYRTGRTNKLRLLLSGKDPAQLGRMLVYYEYFTEGQSEQIARLRDILADLAKRQSALEAKQQQLAARQEDRAATLTHLKNSKAERKATLAALEKRLASRKSTLEDYRTSADNLKDLIGALDRKLSRPTELVPGTFVALKGQMRPPVEGPIVARFGAAKANGLMHWQGQWRAAPKGAPIHAVADGRVVYVGYMHHYGLIVVLEHAGGYFTVYGHALSSYVSAGDYVNRKQAIARVGRSGGHRRSGVYFEIRKGEQALDPSVWLSTK